MPVDKIVITDHRNVPCARPVTPAKIIRMSMWIVLGLVGGAAVSILSIILYVLRPSAPDLGSVSGSWIAEYRVSQSDGASR